MYLLTTYESLQNIGFGISKMKKKYLLVYNSSACAAEGRKTSLVMACNLVLTVVVKDSGSINVDFTKEDISANLNEHYTNDQIRDMLQRKDFDQLDSVLSYGAAFVDRAVS